MSMMGVLTYFFGFQIKQSAKGISVNPEKYVRDLLKKYDINGSSVKTPMVPKRCNMDKKSTLAEYEYVTAARCCENILWMKSQLSDYDSVFRKRDHIIKWDIELHFIPTQYQLTHIFTKPLDEPTFKRLIVELEIGYSGSIEATGTLKKSYLPPKWRLLMAQFIQCSGGKTGGMTIFQNFKRNIGKRLYHTLVDKPVGYKAPKTTPQTKELGREDKKPRAKSGYMKTIPMMMNNPLSKLEATKGVTGEVKADPQLSSFVSASSTEPLYSASTHMHSESASGHDALVDLTAKADLEKSDPKDSLLPRQGVDKGTLNYLFDHFIAGTNPRVLVGKPNYVGDGLGTVQTELEIEKELTTENLFVTDTNEVGESSDDDEIKWDDPFWVALNEL
ncbi:hypothetical protein Tco_0576439 [Tanacetum coccineum]